MTDFDIAEAKAVINRLGCAPFAADRPNEGRVRNATRGSFHVEDGDGPTQCADIAAALNILAAAVAEVEATRWLLAVWGRNEPTLGVAGYAEGTWNATWYDYTQNKWHTDTAPTATALRAKLEGK